MELSLQLQQKQVLSQKMQQSVEILQMNALALSEYAKELAEENPLLEWSEEEEPAEGFREKLLQKLEWLEESDEQNRSFYQMEQEQKEREREDSRFGRKDGQSLREYLLFQINILKIPEDNKKVLRFLAESTAESGYLEADAVECLIERYQLKESTAARILAEFQTLDPPGVGARDLRECLLIQLKQKNASPFAIKMIELHLDDLAKNRLSYIAKKWKISMEELLEALQEIRSCQPKPGSGFAGEEAVEYVIPDILVEKKDQELTVTVNGAMVPRLRVSHAYVKLLREKADAETEEYIADKLKQAEWALQCIAKRESTLQRVAEYIVQHQKKFFLCPNGQLAPLRMADVAEKLEIHESTVSRAVKEKYLQCDRGVFPLHAFFTKAMAREEETVSAESIKEHLRAIIQGENKQKPLSDRELTERLNAEGFQISRRTVAKYREAMGIPGASGRKVY
ncbi:RNA polymerase factor sigma-54 [Anaerotignum sp.]